MNTSELPRLINSRREKKTTHAHTLIDQVAFVFNKKKKKPNAEKVAEKSWICVLLCAYVTFDEIWFAQWFRIFSKQKYSWHVIRFDFACICCLFWFLFQSNMMIFIRNLTKTEISAKKNGSHCLSTETYPQEVVVSALLSLINILSSMPQEEIKFNNLLKINKISRKTTRHGK